MFTSRYMKDSLITNTRTYINTYCRCGSTTLEEIKKIFNDNYKTGFDVKSRKIYVSHYYKSNVTVELDLDSL